VLSEQFNSDIGELLPMALLGRNGVGKTSLLQSLIGQIPFSHGDLSFDGTLFTRKKVHERARAGIGYVPPDREIFRCCP